MYKNARELATELYELRFEYLRLKEKLNCEDETSLTKLVEIRECMLQKSYELARAVLDESTGKRVGA